ncbi:ankyrin [Viridothelium virens]|uniref:Ankyrin n=1 Tax=Viridothelium virens TaxID=1048519 RepID=A0A6A6GT76_VIRVR|nr:ankyrin [Viridothelium virens]
MQLQEQQQQRIIQQRKMQQQAGQISSAQNAGGMAMAPQYTNQSMGSALDDIPIQDADYNFPPTRTASLESACREGSLDRVQSIVTSEQSTPRFLHSGLVSALAAGQVDIARYLLSAGAVISRAVPSHVLTAPKNQQIPSFELLAEHGWTPNSPGFYGDVLLPSVVTDLPLLRWFLDHGANPALGAQRDNRDRMGGSETNSCSALEAASRQGSVEAVRLLLDAGARVEYGLPLHSAAGAHPEGTNIYYPPVHPTPEFDAGADVNQRDESRHMVPRLPILLATMAGAVERVKWLLEHGANPEADGTYGSALSHAERYGDREMKRVIEEGVKARKWV